MKTINRDKIQRMIGQVAGSGGSGGYSSGGDSIITPSWLDENYVAIPYWENLFEAVGTKTTTVGSGTPTTVDYTFDANEKPETKTTTEGGVTTTVTTAVTGVKIKPHYLTGLLGINKTLYFEATGTSYNVGIGVASPDEKFHVNGNSKLWGNITMHGAISGLTSIDGLMYFDNARVGIGVNSPTSKLHVSGTVTASNFIAGTADGSYVKIGPIRIEYEQRTNSLKVYNTTANTVANLYATGAVSALGSNTSGGGGGGLDVEAMWEELGSSTGTYGSSQINPSHLSTNFYTKAQVNNLLQEMSGFVKSVKVGSDAAVTPDTNGVVTLPGFLKLTGGTVTGQITSSLATGTAPLTVASTTLCTNLNADKLDGYDASRLFETLKNSTESGHTNDIEVKIGETTKYLTVGYASKAGQLKTSVTLWGNSFDGSSSIGVLGTPAALNYVSNINNLMYFDANNVGIGTNSPGYKLHVDGSSFLDGQVGIGGFTTSNYKLYVNGTTYLNGNTGVNGNVTLGSSDGTYIKIGPIRIEYEQSTNSLKVYNTTANTVANLYATGAVSALGSNTSGGGGGGLDVEAMWEELGSSTGTYGSSQINISHLSTALNGYATTNALADYLPLAGSASVGANGLAPATNDTALGSSSHRWDLYATAGNFSGAVSAASVSAGGLTVGYATKLSGGAKLTNICIETDRDGNYSPQFPYAHEINDFTAALHLNYSTTNGITICYGEGNGGNVAIGYSAPDTSYKLKVNGSTMIDGMLYVKYFTIQDVSNGYLIGANAQDIYGQGTWHISSDIRRKDIVASIECDINQIAEAPIFDFTWKTDKTRKVHTGTSAQYWRKVLINAVPEGEDGYLYMDDGAIAITAAVMTARKVVRLEEEIKNIKQQIGL